MFCFLYSIWIAILYDDRSSQEQYHIHYTNNQSNSINKGGEVNIVTKGNSFAQSITQSDSLPTVPEAESHSQSALRCLPTNPFVCGITTDIKRSIGWEGALYGVIAY